MSNYFIIIRGPLACGKTTISKILAKKINAKYFSIDKILEKQNLDKVDPKIGCIPEKNFIKAIDTILPKIKNNLKKQNIIFDGCFYHKKFINYLKNNLPHKNYIFTFKASITTCIDRDKNRKISYGKGATQAVHNLVSKFDCGKIINTNKKTINETINEIILSLPSQ